MDKRDYQELKMKQWEDEKKSGKGFGGIFQRLTKTAAPEWVEHWEKMINNAMGFAYDAADELSRANKDKNKRKDLEVKLARMTQKINSEVKDIKPSTDTEDSGK